MNGLENEDSVKTLKACVGKEINEIELEDGQLILYFKDGTGIALVDDAQSCCEHRYMTTDDDLTYFQGSELRSAEVREAPSIEDEYGEHDIAFLIVQTSKGNFTISTHNEHNGYYGGFYLVAKPVN